MDNKGEALNPFCRQLIVKNIDQRVVTQDALFDLIRTINSISRGTFDDHYSRVERILPSERKKYLDGPKFVSGRKRKMSDVDDFILKDIVKEHPFARSRVILEHFLAATDPHTPISKKTREHLVDLPPKHVNKKNSLADPGRQLEFLNFVRPFSHWILCNIDESRAHYGKFIPIMGRRAPKNSSSATFGECRIDTKLVTVVAAYTPFGFCCWRIFYVKPVSAESVHNGSVHKSFRAREALNNVTNGRWVTVPEYSPQFSPIERGFANVWKFLQGMEPHRIQLDPLIALHDALFEYSADGPRGYTALEHFNLYRNNHEGFYRSNSFL